MVTPLFLFILACLIGFAFGYLINQRVFNQKLKDIEKRRESILEEAKREVKEYKERIERETKENLKREREENLLLLEKKKEELKRWEKELSEREFSLRDWKKELEAKENVLLRREREQETKERTIKVKGERLDQLIKEANERLLRIANIDEAQARKEILKTLEEKVKLEAAQLFQEMREEAIKAAELNAREFILQAIQRCAVSQTQESTVSVVSIPSEEIKGRIIGREGRNIRTFENLTGVEVIIDDTPGVITLSSFDPMRRAIAQLAMEKLIADGRIHPARIEEVIELAKKEIATAVEKEGEACAIELGLVGIHPELLSYIGKMKFRSSYGQNLLLHSKEVAHLAAIMASELKLDPALARRAGILHDIGKIADRNQEGTHAQIGAAIAQQFNEDEIIVNAIASHHEEVPFTNPYSFLVAAADSISGSRPGVRRESYETYIKRITKLEEIASTIPGVEKAYAMQAGREVRILVDPEKVSDAEIAIILQKVIDAYEKEIKYPGTIKISVIREKKTIGYAH
ncbi:MAG: ribonuclease Y [candidate division WOR-3 bacterium]